MLMPLVVHPSPLQLTWFVLIAVLWIGFLFLEGFDFGVAMLLPVLGRDERDRRLMINTIGPVWDGNEVWLITAGGATFAAFPGWYATLFSALYLPLLLVVAGLIIRGVAFEYRAKRPNTAWRNAFDSMATVGSFLTTFVLGIAFANFVRGLPVQVFPGASVHVFTGGFWSLFSPFALLGGVALVVICLTHGAIFLALKTKGDFHDRAEALAFWLGLVTIVGGAAFLLVQNLAYRPGGALGWTIAALTAAALIAAVLMIRRGRDGWAFVLTGATIALLAIGIFAAMYPDLGFDNSASVDRPLTIVTASASPLTLRVMSIAAAIFIPIVLAYQAWSYWVFRRRLSHSNIPNEDLYEGDAAVSAVG